MKIVKASFLYLGMLRGWIQHLKNCFLKLLFVFWKLWTIMQPSALCGKGIIVLHSSLGNGAGWPQLMGEKCCVWIHAAASGDSRTHSVLRSSATVHLHLCFSEVPRAKGGWRLLRMHPNCFCDHCRKVRGLLALLKLLKVMLPWGC